MKTLLKLAALASMAAFATGCLLTDYQVNGRTALDNNEDASVYNCQGPGAGQDDVRSSTKAIESAMASMSVFPQTDGTLYAGSCTTSASFSVALAILSDNDMNGEPDLVTGPAGKKLAKAWGRYLGNHMFNTQTAIIGGVPDGHSWTWAMGGVKDSDNQSCNANGFGTYTLSTLLKDNQHPNLVGSNGFFTCTEGGTHGDANESESYGSDGTDVWRTAGIAIDHVNNPQFWNNWQAADFHSYFDGGNVTANQIGRGNEGKVDAGGRVRDSSSSIQDILAQGEGTIILESGFGLDVEASLNAQSGMLNMTVTGLHADGQFLGLTNEFVFEASSDLHRFTINQGLNRRATAEIGQWLINNVATVDGDWVITIDSQSVFNVLGLTVEDQVFSINKDLTQVMVDRANVAVGNGLGSIERDALNRGGFRRLR